MPKQSVIGKVLQQIDEEIAALQDAKARIVAAEKKAAPVRRPRAVLAKDTTKSA